MPFDIRRYPANWREFSRQIRSERAADRCECVGQCGLHRTNPGPRRCIETNRTPARWARGRIVLTVAHLCGCGPPCADAAHVAAMCQRCHLRVDAELHARNSRATRARKLAAGTLPLPMG